MIELAPSILNALVDRVKLIMVYSYCKTTLLYNYLHTRIMYKVSSNNKNVAAIASCCTGNTSLPTPKLTIRVSSDVFLNGMMHDHCSCPCHCRVMDADVMMDTGACGRWELSIANKIVGEKKEVIMGLYTTGLNWF
jgi:hypothetical protein